MRPIGGVSRVDVLACTLPDDVRNVLPECCIAEAGAPGRTRLVSDQMQAVKDPTCWRRSVPATCGTLSGSR